MLDEVFLRVTCFNYYIMDEMVRLRSIPFVQLSPRFEKGYWRSIIGRCGGQGQYKYNLDTPLILMLRPNLEPLQGTKRRLRQA